MDQTDKLPEAVKAVFRVRDAVLVSYIEVWGGSYGYGYSRKFSLSLALWLVI